MSDDNDHMWEEVEQQQEQEEDVDDNNDEVELTSAAHMEMEEDWV